jgi:uncharacterized protein (TIGR02996 family)
MTDEEPFIRAIVDSPGDETPRLVYADWLEERGDPRGAYLRAEHAWARSRKPSPLKKVRRFAKPLDAVWLARVSRPPVGVCLEHPLFRRAKKLTTELYIHDQETSFGVGFPPAYRAFLLNYNGGGFLYDLAAHGGEIDETLFSDVFAGIGLGKEDFDNLATFVDSIYDGGNGVNFGTGLFPIGAPDHERTIYLLGVEVPRAWGDYYGRVYRTEEPSEQWPQSEWLEQLADSFPEFLAKLSDLMSWD